MLCKKQILSGLQGPLYRFLGYRERQTLDTGLLHPCGWVMVKTLPYGTVSITTPGGEFEIAWDLSNYKRGTVVG